MCEAGNGFAWFEVGLIIEHGFVDERNLGQTSNLILVWKKMLMMLTMTTTMIMMMLLEFSTRSSSLENCQLVLSSLKTLSSFISHFFISFGLFISDL